ncbi:hypothetical protein [Thermoanaerobacter siderophilus]|uniref:Uncharacterized protein n=1 Tax=Thermoanaerobacter siderophilus SR4 TaxID=880478 RepID=I9KVS1_9THEO|nr:hypothetical protein [Thermoanaerobacter siderophilus]EIW00991.1 hypothetical protein ThesiDRAFT1_2133 [Thermoanaerobacter siderophilus SR4]
MEVRISTGECKVGDANYEIVKQLQEFVNGQIDLGEKIVDAYIVFKENRNNANAQRINELINQFNEKNREKNNIIVEILKKANMPYTIDNNGTIHYQYIP